MICLWLTSRPGNRSACRLLGRSQIRPPEQSGSHWFTSQLGDRLACRLLGHLFGQPDDIIF